MRLASIATLTAVAAFGGVSGTLACEPITAACAPSVVVWPVFTEDGRPLGTIEAPVQRPPQLEVSRFTAQPITVIYDHPGRRPGSVEPYTHLVPLPRAKRSNTIGAYPVGY